MDDRFTLWEVVFAGISLHFLMNVTENTPIEASSPYELGALEHCRNLSEFIDRFQLQDSDRRVGTRLRDVIARLQRMHQSDSNSVDGLESQLKLMARDLRATLEREGLERSVFCSMPERAIQVRDLLDDPARWFGISFGEKLSPPPGVLDDFQEAAKAFAVGFPASAIVFTLRATEGMLRAYYEAVVGEVPSPQATWGSITRRLKDTGRCPNPLLENLESLRDLRNEAMHAGPRQEERWGHEAASQILLKCREIILSMSTHVERSASTDT